MEDQKSNERSGLDHMARAAGTVKGAVKAGKQLAGAAKGAAKGAALGPYGLAAGLALENRKIIGKVLLALIALMLLPVVILVMLPSALFSAIFPSGESSPDQIAVADEIVFEDYGAVGDIYEEVCMEIHCVFDEAHTSALQNINADFASYGAPNTMTVTDPFSSTLPHDAARIICEYSALTDFEETVDCDALKEKLSDYKDHFFFFIKEEEQKIHTETVIGEDGIPCEVSIPYTQVNYTLKYVGDDFITEDIFRLTDAQKVLAEDFSDSLQLYMGG